MENLTPLVAAVVALVVIVLVFIGGKLKLPFFESEGGPLRSTGRVVVVLAASLVLIGSVYSIFHAESGSKMDCGHAKVNGQANANGQGGTAIIANCVDQSGAPKK